MTANTLITFLFIVRAGCDWIEITQQYYKKPVQLSHQYTETTDITGDMEIYANHSITEHKWNKKPDNRSPSRLKTEPSDVDMVHKEHKFKNAELNSDSIQKEGTGNVKRISHPGKVDRVQLTTALLKSSTVEPEPEIVNSYHRTSYNTFVTSSEINIEATTETLFDYHKNLHETKFKNDISKYELRNYTVSKAKPLMKNVESLKETLNTNRFLRIPEINSQNAKEFYNKTNRESVQDILNKKSEVATIDSLNNLTINTADKAQLKTNKKIEYNDRDYDINPAYIKTSIIGNYEETTKEKPLSRDENSNAVEVIVKFVKLVSKTISSNTRRGFSSKVRYLEDLKNNLIANIEERIEATWPDNYDKRNRRSRETEGSARGHLEFPSSETTLMSISFLTFAVFLIKLVLQVIQTYKNKSMMVAPVVVATAGRAAFIHSQRKKHN